MLKKKIAIIGAGPSGICAAKHSLDRAHDVTVFEQNSDIGGTWIYTDETEYNSYGLPIHSSIYKGLITNIPVESMGFFDFPFQRKTRSFVPHSDVLDYLHEFVNRFDLRKIIKLCHQVMFIQPVKESNRWKVLSKNLENDSYKSEIFDAVFLCNGHYNEPFHPMFDGLERFKGRQMHSHGYRKPDLFQNENVLIIGAGPSGKDIIHEIATKAERVYFSHHRDLTGNVFASNVKQMGDIKCFTENCVEFVNGSREVISIILFCTGYKFSFPFLSIDCGLTLKEGFLVEPLYKHIININYPTMAIIGLQICAYSYMYDLQVRYCLKLWNNEIELQPKEKMLKINKLDKEKRQMNGKTIRQSHLLASEQKEYMIELSESGNLIKTPNVLFKIYEDCNDLRIQYPNHYREFNYTIVDEETFTRERI